MPLADLRLLCSPSLCPSTCWLLAQHVTASTGPMDRYARSLARVAVAQIAEVAGFESVQESAADILADLLCRYQLTLCTDAQHLAELAGRTEMNLTDAFMALEDLQTTPDDLLQYLQLQVCGRMVSAAPLLRCVPLRLSKYACLLPHCCSRRRRRTCHSPTPCQTSLCSSSAPGPPPSTT